MKKRSAAKTSKTARVAKTARKGSQLSKRETRHISGGYAVGHRSGVNSVYMFIAE